MKRVLIIDDDQAIRRAFVDILSSIPNIETRTAANGLVGWELLQAWRPDCVFLDGNMPKMNGNELARLVRADAELRQTPLISISGSGANDFVGMDLQMLSDYVMRKPFGTELIHKMVAKALDLPD